MVREPPKKKLKKSNQQPPDADAHPLYIDVGDEGAQSDLSRTVKCKRATEDWVILYEEQNINVFTSFLQQSLNITFWRLWQQEVLQSKWKYAKKAADAKGESPENDDWCI